MTEPEREGGGAVLAPARSGGTAKWDTRLVPPGIAEGSAATARQPVSAIDGAYGDDEREGAGIRDSGDDRDQRDSGAGESDEGEDAGTGPVQAEVNQSLARLEMNTLAVKLHLDSIDQRISRMEPRLEGMRGAEVAAETGAAPVPVPMPVETPAEPKTEMRAEPAARRDERVGKDVEPGLPTTERRRRAQGVPVERRRAPHPTHVEVEEREPWEWRPWFVAHRLWVTPLAVGLVALIAAMLWGTGQHGRPKPVASGEDAGSLVAKAVGNGARKSSADVTWAAGARGGPVRPSGMDRGGAVRSGSTTVEQGVAVPVAGGGAVAPADPGQVQGTATPDAGALPGDSTAERLEGAGSGGVAAVTSSAPTRAGSSFVGRSVPTSSGRVQVSSGVMAGNLIYSRPPAYPHGLVGLFHEEGKVVMQAIISKSGRVENVRVISGHRMLRGAAKDAVRAWRYRPYYINGSPVEVATIVSVEFHR